MMKGFRPQSIRTRLTLWYIAVLAGALLVYGVSTAALLVFQLRGQLDHRVFLLLFLLTIPKSSRYRSLLAAAKTDDH